MLSNADSWPHFHKAWCKGPAPQGDPDHIQVWEALLQGPHLQIMQKHSRFLYPLTTWILVAFDLQTRRYIHEPHWKLDRLSVQESGLQGIHQWRICGDQSSTTTRGAFGTPGYGTDHSRALPACTHTHTHTHMVRHLPKKEWKEQSSLTAFIQGRQLSALPLSGSVLCAQLTQTVAWEDQQITHKQESLSSRQSNQHLLPRRSLAAPLLSQKTFIWNTDALEQQAEHLHSFSKVISHPWPVP